MRVSRAWPTVCTLLAGAAVGCRGPSDPGGPELSYTVRLRAGDQQRAPAGSVLVEPLTVVVTDSLGVPIRGVPVGFRIIGGRGASLLDSLVVTDASGTAATRLRVGADRDTTTVRAAIAGREAAGVRFVAVATPPAVLRQLQPAALAAGDTLTLRGSHLTEPGTASTVLFGGVRAPVLGAVGDSLLRVLVPPCLVAGELPVTVQVGLAVTNALAAAVAPAGRTLALQPFEAVTVAGADVAGCVRLPGDGGRYLVLTQFAAVDDPSSSTRAYALTIDATTAAGALAAALARPLTTEHPLPPVARVPTLREIFERRLRAAEAELAVADAGQPRIAADLAPLAGRQPPAPPALGAERTFRVLARVDGSVYTNSVARLRYAGAHVLVYEDRGTPAPLDDPAMRQLGDLLDRELYPLDVETFGTESDIDGDGRVVLLLTPIVNALTPAAQCGSDGYVRGFFFGADLGTRSLNSNRGEILYGFVPDPQGLRSCPHDAAEVLRQLPPTFVHEFQHMISYQQHVLVRRGADESVWLNEGLSHTAEAIAAARYEARYPAPLGRAVGTQLLPDSAIPFYRGDIENALLYLGSPSAHSVTSFRELGSLEERGASWLFVRWLLAQRGPSILPRLVQTPRTGRRNVEEVMGEPFPALFADFVIALSADSVPGVPRSRIPSRYRFGERALRDLLTRGLGRTARWPLAARTAPAIGSSALGSMVPGTFDLYDLTVPRGRPLTLRFGPPSGGSFPAALDAQLGLLRLDPAALP